MELDRYENRDCSHGVRARDMIVGGDTIVVTYLPPGAGERDAYGRMLNKIKAGGTNFFFLL